MEPIAQVLTRAVKMKTCETCGSEFVLDTTLGAAMERWVKECPGCADATIKRQDADATERRKSEAAGEVSRAWDAICPALFKETEISKLPCPSALEEVLRWKFGPNGLVLHGPSGKGKSRCAWIVLEREFRAGRRFKVLDSMAGLKYAAKFSDSAEQVEMWVEDLIAVDLLFMDDIFKNKLTDSFEGVIFTLLDQRIQARRPVIITSNDTGKTLAGRMTEDRSEPLIRRIREHSTTVLFK